MIGEQLGNYVLTCVLGEGGMGTVYAARHVVLGRDVAVKVLLPGLSHSEDAMARFFTEARVVGGIRHPGIVEVFDLGCHSDGRAFIAMELLAGCSLGARMAREPVACVEALRLVRQIAGVLRAAHDAGVIHRDLKPDNVFLVPDLELGTRVKLLDFGIAKLAGDGAGMHKTQTGAVLGTPGYMAPEQCRGVRIDHRVDLYALGCMLFELLVGRPPFLGEGIGDLLVAHIHTPPPSPATGSARLDDLVLRLLAKDPAARPSSAAAVIAELDELEQLEELRGSGAGGEGARPGGQGAALAPGAPTTLGSATGSARVRAAAPRARRGWISIAAGAVAGAAVIAVLVVVGASRGASHESGVAPAAPPRETVVAPAPVPAPAPAPVAPAEPAQPVAAPPASTGSQPAAEPVREAGEASRVRPEAALPRQVRAPAREVQRSARRAAKARPAGQPGDIVVDELPPLPGPSTETLE